MYFSSVTAPHWWSSNNSHGENSDAEGFSVSFGGTPLSQAALHGPADVVRTLLDAGATVETRHQCEIGTTPLNYSTHIPAGPFGKEAREAVVRTLLEYGASTETVRTDWANKGRTPLIVQASARYGLGIIRILLDKGANIEARDARGSTALSRAVKFGQVDNVRLLLECDADPSSVNL